VYRLELLSRAHNRDGFDCGNAPLNLYLRQTARQHTERGISRTFVLVEESATTPKSIAGFVTLNICQLDAEQLPPEVARRLPRQVNGIKLGGWPSRRTSSARGLAGSFLLPR